MTSTKYKPKHRYSRALAPAQDGPVVAYFHGVMRWSRQPGDKLTPWQRISIVGAPLAMVVTVAILAIVFWNFIEVALEGDPARNR